MRTKSGNVVPSPRLYLTRRGWLPLVPRDAEAVERALTTTAETIAVLREGGTVRCRPPLAAALAAWLDNMWDTAREKAGGRCEPRRGVIVATSAYRRWGTSCGLGTPFADPAGALDSHDEWGHWSGWAIDVPTRYTRETFSPVLTIRECWDAAARAGLIRPFKDEYWHWRPKVIPY